MLQFILKAAVKRDDDYKKKRERESVFSVSEGRGDGGRVEGGVYPAVNSTIMREFGSPCAWFAFCADAGRGALQAVFAALLARICIFGEIRQYTRHTHQND